MTRRWVGARIDGVAEDTGHHDGWVAAIVEPVHTHTCPHVRHPVQCVCGANAAFDALGFGDDPPQGWAGIVAAAVLATGGTVLDDPAVTAAFAAVTEPGR